MILKESVEGCEDCAAEEAWKISQGHTCGSSTKAYHTWCDIVGESRRANPEYHRMTHEPQRCDKCGEVTDDHRGDVHLSYRKCGSGQCDEWVCEYCGELAGSAGPVDCSACSSMSGDG